MKRDVADFMSKCGNCPQGKYEHQRPSGLTKSANFIPVQVTNTAESLGRIYVRDIFFLLAEFAYNNSYHSSFDMAPFEALYSRRCSSPIRWFDAFEVRPWGTDLLRESMDRVKLIQEKLLAA
ncbi:uncharacterized protein LOC132637550 [Lycium barbarum]|uniref:uncharacterized protein LOC132637550 n=1 Tax=Lycium barbarum TaxID=112863 RepID=UPI00293EA2E9|nr:uncharacterized protein LOC132637550 [Lycium barbarum]